MTLTREKRTYGEVYMRTVCKHVGERHTQRDRKRKKTDKKDMRACHINIDKCRQRNNIRHLPRTLIRFTRTPNARTHEMRDATLRSTGCDTPARHCPRSTTTNLRKCGMGFPALVQLPEHSYSAANETQRRHCDMRQHNTAQPC